MRIPELAIDKVLYKNRPMLPRAKVERRVFANLIAHLTKAGFTLKYIWDGDVAENVSTIKEAMEIVFNLDQCHAYFTNKEGIQHWVFFVFGNDGWDCINDWNYTEKDPDGFDKAMQTFDPEQFI